MTAVSGATITLDSVVKQYRGQDRPAVDRIDLDIAAGEIVALVGPSGCGKTTILKMINRLIEPTSGRILIGGRDVTGENPDKLRQSIGYVIQSGGLFPHWSVARNIGAVPRILGWDRTRITERTEYLLKLVGLDPGTFADRLPRDMSGGQQQRVGVARALAADPPVLLMDEPFGAVDPITRIRLQDSLIEIQRELGKTVVVVTHDIAEATKLGDRVLVLSEGGHVEQYATPAQILAAPATPFVTEFIGSGATLAYLTVRRVSDIEYSEVVTARIGERAQRAVERARAAGQDRVVVIDEQRRPRAWPDLATLARTQDIEGAPDPRLPVVERSATLHDALDTVLGAPDGIAVVVDEDAAVAGALDLTTLVRAIRTELSDENRGETADSGTEPTPGADAVAADESAGPV
ncbi:MAG: ATP-binding cassette domain-containing protein [Nocardia sp.]|nr:ATP-binding cassette domain-containing protein [Nocardia sp.]